MPGEDPGIYACDYPKLAQIHSRVAKARVALLQGDLASAQVSASAHVPLLLRVTCLAAVTCSQLHFSMAHETHCLPEGLLSGHSVQVTACYSRLWAVTIFS